MGQDRLTEGALLFPGMTTPQYGGPPGGYHIRRAIDAGGFGITYEAVKRDGADPASDVTANLWLPPHRAIVIKEFFPDFASRRGRSITVEGEDEGHEETFNHALRRFQREAERLCYLTCLRALRAGRGAIDSSGSLAQKIDRELASGNSDPSRAMQLVGRLSGAGRTAAQQALATSTLPIVYDFFAADNNAYYVMEYLGGGTLKARLNEDRRNSGMTRVDVAGTSFQLRRPWEVDRLRRFASAALDALEELHTGIPGQQLIHCDLKPGNIMFRSADSDDPVLIDFGLARNVNDGKSRSLVAGTLGFAPLEIDPHLRAHYGDNRFGGANVGPWTDIYSMAAILRMLATGVEGSRLPSVFDRVRTPDGDIDPTDKLPPFPDEFPAQMAEAIRHGMGLHKHQRPQTISEWRRALGLFDNVAPSIGSTGARSGWALDPGATATAFNPRPTAAEPVSIGKRAPAAFEDETLIERSAGSRQASAPQTSRPSRSAPQPSQPPQQSWPAPSAPTERGWAPEPPSYPPAARQSSWPEASDDEQRQRFSSRPMDRQTSQPRDNGRRPSASGGDFGIERLDIGRVISLGLAMARRNLPSLLILGLLLGGLPSGILVLFSSADPSTGSATSALALLAIMVIWPIGLVASGLLQAMGMRLAIEQAGGRPAGIGDLMGGAFAMILPLAGIMLLTSFAIIFGLFLLIVPGLFLACMWLVAVQALAAEGLSVSAALDRSRYLTNGSRLMIFVLLLIYFVCALVLRAPSSLLGLAEVSRPVLFVVETIVATFTSVIWVCGLAQLYLELRRLKGDVMASDLAEIFD